MKIYAFIFARGGSKGVPGKNIRTFIDKPLMEHSIELAKNIKQIDKIFVSTEDEKIADIAKLNNINLINRPKELADDHSPEWDAWNHAIQHLKNEKDDFDIFVSLPTTAPLRKNIDVINCINTLNEDIDIVVSIVKSQKSPWFNMVCRNQNSELKLILNNDEVYNNRQATPDIYDLTTVAYVTTPKFILSSKGVFDGKVVGVEVPLERAIDIDTEFDFKIAELLFERKK